MVLLEHPVSKADKTHRNMGRKLGDRMIKVLIPALNEIHVVIPIPEKSNTNAPCVSESVGKRSQKGPLARERSKGPLTAWKLTTMAKSVPLSDSTTTANGNGVLHVTGKRRILGYEDKPSTKH